jgi:D-ribose pyranose/furanose isomerase RbsD
MLKTGILNPQVNSLLSRVRHTNLLVIADRGFPYWPMIETIDIALVDDLPTVLQVLAVIRSNFGIGRIIMARVLRAMMIRPCRMNSRTPPQVYTAFSCHMSSSSSWWLARSA